MSDKKVLPEGVGVLRGEERAVFLPIKRKKLSDFLPLFMALVKADLTYFWLLAGR